ncbi:MAG: hypothetical protein QG673_924 [Pseudomonadota bacterium]|nr:hypothetical protein [Pseudomonadota bacterium]
MKRLLSLLLATSALTAIADGNNLYVGAGAGLGWNDIQAPDAAFRVDGGVNFTDNWAMEIGTTGLTQSGSTPNQSMQYYDLSVKGTLPLSEAFGLFLQLGGAYGSPGATADNAVVVGSTVDSYNQSQQAGWNFLTAAGLQFNLTHQVSLNLTDYYYYGATNPQGNTNVLLGGVKFNF